LFLLAPYMMSRVWRIAALWRGAKITFCATNNGGTRVCRIVRHLRGTKIISCAAHKTVLRDRCAKTDLHEHRHHMQKEAVHGALSDS
jgi:hypothetical protein